MSAIGRSSETGDEYYIYVKGLPQGMYPIFEKQTLPYNYF